MMWPTRCTRVTSSAMTDGAAVARATPMRWDIQTCATRGRDDLLWGDYHFALDLASALGRLGQVATVLRFGEPAGAGADVVLHLRGNRPLPPRRGAVNILWVISHPDDISAQEILDEYDHIFAAGPPWAAEMSRRWALTIDPLPQATNAARFSPDIARAPEHPAADRLLLVANARGGDRPVARDAVALGARPAIYGANWESGPCAELVEARYLPNEDLPQAYRSARAVLNDHWPDMRRWGFISNRVFDAAASGTPVISDSIAGLAETFGPLTRQYETLEELRAAISSSWPGEDELVMAAQRVRAEHSFDRRAAVLVETAERYSRGSQEGDRS